MSGSSDRSISSLMLLSMAVPKVLRDSGTPFPDAVIARKPENKDSRKARPKFVTTAVYHLSPFWRSSRPISRRLRDSGRP